MSGVLIVNRQTLDTQPKIMLHGRVEGSHHRAWLRMEGRKGQAAVHHG